MDSIPKEASTILSRTENHTSTGFHVNIPTTSLHPLYLSVQHPYATFFFKKFLPCCSFFWGGKAIRNADHIFWPVTIQPITKKGKVIVTDKGMTSTPQVSSTDS